MRKSKKSNNHRKKYDLAIVGTCGLPSNYGGFETLAENLVNELASPEYSILIVGSKGYKRIYEEYWMQLTLPLGANGIQSIIYDIISLIIALRSSKVVLALGISGGIVMPLLRLIYRNSRLVTHIDGLEWSRQKWGYVAKQFLCYSERLAIHSSDAFIVDNLGIADYISRNYSKRYLNRASLIAYGHNKGSIDISQVSSVELTSVSGQLMKIDTSTKFILVLCRAEAENNLDLIISAFKSINRSQKCMKGVTLLLLTNACSTNYGHYLIKKYANEHNIFFSKAVYENITVSFIRQNCLAYIHGHSAGGSNPSLIESMAYRRPIVALDVSFNRYTTFDTVDYFKDSEQLTSSIKRILLNPVIQNEAKDLALEHYNWPTIASKYLELFNYVNTVSLSGRRLIFERFTERLRLRLKYTIKKTAHYLNLLLINADIKHDKGVPNRPPEH